MENNPMLGEYPASEEAITLAAQLSPLEKREALHRVFKMTDEGHVELEDERQVLIFSVKPEGRFVTMTFEDFKRPGKESVFVMCFVAKSMTVETSFTEDGQEIYSVEDKNPYIPQGFSYRFKQTFTLG